MQVKEFKNELEKATKMKTAYLSYPVNKAPKLPYTVYYFPGNEDLSADNINYSKINDCIIELYTKEKDFDKELLVEDFINNVVGTYYDKDETYLNSEEMYMVTYDFSLLIDTGGNYG